MFWEYGFNFLSSSVITHYGVTWETTRAQKDHLCAIVGENPTMTAKNLSRRNPLLVAKEENLLSEENESANCSHEGTDILLADILSTEFHCAVHGKPNETVTWCTRGPCHTTEKGDKNLMQLVQWVIVEGRTLRGQISRNSFFPPNRDLSKNWAAHC